MVVRDLKMIDLVLIEVVVGVDQHLGVDAQLKGFAALQRIADRAQPGIVITVGGGPIVYKTGQMANTQPHAGK